MGKIANVQKTEAVDGLNDVTAEIAAGDVRTARLFAPSGDDSPPIANDRIVLVQIDGAGRFAAVGVLNESQGAKPGEKILYSRDSSGEVKAALKLLNDGKIEMVSPESLSFSGSEVEVSAKEKMKLESKEIELTGGKVVCKGASTPTGQGGFCAMPYCAFTGAPQTGTEINGT